MSLAHLGSAAIGLVWGWLVAGPRYHTRGAVVAAALASAAVLGQVWLMTGSAVPDAALTAGFAMTSAATRRLVLRRLRRRGTYKAP